jgi:hypothetical protein
MDADERDIFHFLKTRQRDFTHAMEICRRASTKKRFHDDPNWAKPILMRMVERGILESNSQGRFRIKPAARKKKGAPAAAPNVATILKESGVEAEAGDEGNLAADEYYEHL